MEHILDFCLNCGELIPSGVGMLPREEQVCENCHNKLSERDHRIQGFFIEEEALRLRKAFGQA